MTRHYRSSKFYAVYTINDELVMVGNVQECADFMGLKKQSFRCRLTHVKSGRIKEKRVKYKVYEIKEGEDDV